jgi:hypothetical protein
MRENIAGDRAAGNIAIGALITATSTSPAFKSSGVKQMGQYINVGIPANAPLLTT